MLAYFVMNGHSVHRKQNVKTYGYGFFYIIGSQATIATYCALT